MKYALDTFVGDGSPGNEFRPAHADGFWTIIDLRPDPTVQAGFCLVGAESISRAVLDLGDDTLDERMHTNRRRAFGNRLGVKLNQRNLRAQIAELLLVHGSFPDRSRWNPLRANIQNRHEIWLAGEKIYDAPAIMGTVITESFDKADSDTLGPDLAWTELRNDWDVVSNQCELMTVGTALGVARADSDLASDDNYTEVVLVTLDNPSAATVSNGGPICRVSSSAMTGYQFKRRKSSGSTADYRLEKLVAGSVTSLTSFTTLALSLPETLKVQANGTSIKGYIGGVEKATVTDSSITTGVRGGLIGYKATSAANIIFDSFEAGDVSGSALTLAPDGDGTNTNVFNEVGATTDLYQSVDDDPDTPTTTDWVSTGEADGSVFFDLSATPSDFGTIQTPLTVRADLAAVNFSTDTCTIYAQVFASDETTAYTDEQSFGTQASSGLVTQDLTVNSTGLAALKTAWDAARVKVRWDYTV